MADMRLPGVLAAVDEGEIGDRLDDGSRAGAKVVGTQNPENRVRAGRNKVWPALTSAQSQRGISPSTVHHNNFNREIMSTLKFAGESPTRQLVTVFCLWKALLLTLAAFCPGPGYDTSALILLDTSPWRHGKLDVIARHERFVLNLLRWDALYFVKAAERGYVHEQAWAFSGVYSHLLRLAGQREQQ
jgi:hypothetical protein